MVQFSPGQMAYVGRWRKQMKLVQGWFQQGSKSYVTQSSVTPRFLVHPLDFVEKRIQLCHEASSSM